MPMHNVPGLPPVPEESLGPHTALNWQAGFTRGPDGLVRKVARAICQSPEAPPTVLSGAACGPLEVLVSRAVGPAVYSGFRADGTPIWSRVAEYRYLVLAGPGDLPQLLPVPAWAALAVPLGGLPLADWPPEAFVLVPEEVG